MVNPIRESILSLFLLITGFQLLLSGCTSDESNLDEVSTGSIQPQITWVTNDSTKARSVDLFGNTLPSDLVTVRITVSGSGMSSIQRSFAAQDRSGTITGIPVGFNRTFTVDGLNSQSQIAYSGTKNNISIEENRSTPVQIDAVEVDDSIAIDNVAPVISLIGSSNFILNVGDNYSDDGAVASDNVDGDISLDIVVTGSVDTEAAGIYMLTYNVYDATGNSASPVTRTVNVIPVLFLQLNDTGITWGGNFSDGNNAMCIGETVDEQDCAQGRDALAAAGSLIKVGAGHAGFDFTKLDSNGNDLPSTASIWSCVRDNHTGLVWEVKTNDGGIHDAIKTYRWGGATALLIGTFGALYNDWDTLVDGSNREVLCGFSDWRVPAREQLMSIVNRDRITPAIDDGYFPNTVSETYWSASAYPGNSTTAWYVGFSVGNGNIGTRGNTGQVRLVRGGE